MSNSHETPRKLWFTPLPNRNDPMGGGALLNILPYGDDPDLYTVGLDLARLLGLQRALASLVNIVVVNSLTGKGAEVNPITEDEIAKFVSELDQPIEKEETDE